MSKQLLKEVTPILVDVSKIIVDRALNYREVEGYDVTNLVDDLALRGQQDPVTLEKMPDGTYRPVKGFRRCTAIQEMASKGVIDPKTGKPFSHVIAIVYEGLTDGQRFELKLDHGQRRNLNKAELFFALEDGFRCQYTEKGIVTVSRDLLELHYPPTRKIDPPTPENYLNYYRGVIQTARRAAFAPKVLRDAWVEKLRGKQAWPAKAEMEEMSRIFVKEMEEDSSNTINRNNPGPKFLERWNEYLKKQEEAAKTGQARAKTDSMMNRDQIEKLKPASDSIFAKSFVDCILRKRDGEVWGKLDQFLAKVVEPKLSEEEKAQLQAILAAATPQA